MVRGQNMLNLYPGEVELVMGVGPIGLMHMQVARQFGARVIAADLVPERLEKARSLGAEWTINPKEADLPALVKEVTGGWGADAAVVSVGSARLVDKPCLCWPPAGGSTFLPASTRTMNCALTPTSSTTASSS